MSIRVYGFNQTKRKKKRKKKKKATLILIYCLFAYTL